MNTRKTKVNTAINCVLDWMAAKAEGTDPETLWAEIGIGEPAAYQMTYPEYSTDWTQGGPIIEREGIAIHPQPCWTARYGLNIGGRHFQMTGPTPLIAAMRCFVVSRLGDEVEVPEELLK